MESFLIMHETIPHSTTGIIPAKLLFRRTMSTCIPGSEEFPVDDQEV